MPVATSMCRQPVDVGSSANTKTKGIQAADDNGRCAGERSMITPE